MSIYVTYYVLKNGSVLYPEQYIKDRILSLKGTAYTDAVRVSRRIQGGYIDSLSSKIGGTLEFFENTEDLIIRKDPSLWGSEYAVTDAHGSIDVPKPKWWTEKHSSISDNTLVDYLDKNVYYNQHIKGGNKFRALFISNCNVDVLGAGSIVGHIYNSDVDGLEGGAIVGELYNTNVNSISGDSGVGYALGNCVIGSLTDNAAVFDRVEVGGYFPRVPEVQRINSNCV